MTSQAPMVSVACITYNHEKYIAQALDSFLIQETNFDYEIVIGEDCSTDGTLAIIHEYQAKYTNKIRIVSSAGNVGLAKNFIRTLAACEGKYIAYCDCDDYWTDPTKLQKQFDCLEVNPQAACCFHPGIKIDDNGICIEEYIGRHDSYYEYSREQLMLTYPNIYHQTIFFRNIDIIKEYPKEAYNTISQDVFLYSILGLYGTAIYLPNIKPSHYRFHQTNVTYQMSQLNKLVLNVNCDLLRASFFKNAGEDYVSSQYLKRGFRAYTRHIGVANQFKLAFLRLFKVFRRK